MVSLTDIQDRLDIQTFIRQSNETLKALGYTEHGFRHVGLVAKIAHALLTHLARSNREAELAAIAGYTHDIGNLLGRDHHGQNSAMMLYPILRELDLPIQEVGTILGAVGNHEEEYGEVTSPVAAALVLADKSDVHISRLQNTDPSTFDLHDRVNHAVTRSFLRVIPEEKAIVLELTIKPEISVMDYFEIFLSRMVMCRRAAKTLSQSFFLDINGHRLL